MGYYGRNGYATRSCYGGVEYTTLKTLGEIEKIIEPLKVSILEKGFATVEEYYLLTNGGVVQSDSDFGWTDLTDITIKATRYGYLLQMPFPQNIIPKNPIKEAIDILRDADYDSLPDAVQDVCNILQDSLK